MIVSIDNFDACLRRDEHLDFSLADLLADVQLFEVACSVDQLDHSDACFI